MHVIKVSHKFANMSDANSPPSSPSAEIKSESGQPLEPPPKLVKHRPSLLPFFPSNDEETNKLFLELFAEDLKAAEASADAKVSHSSSDNFDASLAKVVSGNGSAVVKVTQRNSRKKREAKQSKARANLLMKF